MGSRETIQSLERRLASLDSERSALLTELERERKALANEPRPLPELVGRPAQTSVPITSAEKIQLFLDLFRCREDVYTNPDTSRL